MPLTRRPKMSWSSRPHRYAGFWIRCLAWLIDSAAFMVAFLVVFAVVGTISGWGSNNQLVGTFYVLGTLLGLIYWAWFWSAWSPIGPGQTIGMKALGLRVIRTDGSALSFPQSGLRWLGWLLSAVPLALGLIWMVFDPRKQGWHDKLADTLIVRVSNARAAGREERRHKALEMLSAGERVPLSLQSLVRDELKARDRQRALAMLAQGQKVPFLMHSVVRDELAASKAALELAKLEVAAKARADRDRVREANAADRAAQDAVSRKLKEEGLAVKAAVRAERDTERQRLKEERQAAEREAAKHRPTVEVVRYNTPRDYQRDAQHRLENGWTLQAQSQETGQTHRLRRASGGALIGGLFMMPMLGAAIGGLSNKRTPGVITATWIKPPAGDSDASGVAAETASGTYPEPPSPQGLGGSDLFEQLKKLGELRDAGVLTAEEFDAKKAEILARM
ncbi:MAG TPA: RDD family protein [Candidatus Acidoferrales bacterium]|nr:RDD family protein [Candidatus Acidoferrales bacterium]